LGRSPGGGHGNTFQYSCLGNPMDRAAWRAMVHTVAKSWTRMMLKLKLQYFGHLVRRVQSLVRELRFCKLCGKPPKILDYKFFIRYMFCLWKQIKIQKVLHEVFHFNVIYNCDEIGKKLQSKEYFSHLLTLKI